MKLVNDKNNLKTNFKGESQNFGIGDASVVIEILRNRLYKNKIQTLVQEYCSNARDAMREASSNKPIRVTMPSQFDPTFKVRDFGLGVSPERMSSVFVLYGASTKRQDNKETGGFGIGAKSAWAYTDSFNIITFIDGLKRTYVAHTGESSNGRLDLINTENTDEENGTEIQIAVSPSDVDAFKRAALRATYFWNEDVEFKGYEVSPDDMPIRVLGETFTEHMEIQKDIPNFIKPSFNRNNMAVIDGIPYSISEFSDKVKELKELETLINRSFILHVPNGFLEVSASREEISDSKHTISNLTALCKKLKKEAHKVILKEFSEVNTVQDYLKTYIDLSSKFNVQEYNSYQSYEIRNQRLHNDLFELVEIYKCYEDGRGLKKIDVRGYRSSYNGNFSLALEDLENLFFDESGESKVKQNKRIRSYLKDNQRMFLIKQKQISDLSDKVYKTAYKELKRDLNIKSLTDIEIEDTIVHSIKAQKKLEKNEVCLHLLKRGHENYSARYFKDINLQDNKQKFLYITLNGGSWAEFDKNNCYALQKYLLDYKICGISKSNLTKIKGDKNFIPLKSFLDNYKVTKEDIQSYKGECLKWYDFENIELLQQLKGIKSTFLKQFIKEYKSISGANIPVLITNQVENHPESKQAVSQIESFRELLDKDLLLVKKFTERSNLSEEIKNELVFYINAKTKGAK